MSQTILRPPLPPPLSHEGIAFLPTSLHQRLPAQTLAAIAGALQSLIPAGDWTTDESGRFIFSSPAQGAAPSSLWRQAGLLEGIERGQL